MSKKSRRPGRATRHQRPSYRPDPPATTGPCCPICDAMGIEINEDGEIVNLGQRVEITIDVAKDWRKIGSDWFCDRCRP